MEEFQINDKVVLMCPIDIYVDVFSMTGNIIFIEGIDDDKLYSIKIDEPDLLMAPMLWAEDNQYICKVTKDFIVPLNELDPKSLKWINKGKEILENTNCFGGLIRYLQEIIHAFENDQTNVAIISLSRLDISWMENYDANELFNSVKATIANSKMSVKRCLKELKTFETYVKKRQLMIN